MLTEWIVTAKKRAEPKAKRQRLSRAPMRERGERGWDPASIGKGGRRWGWGLSAK